MKYVKYVEEELYEAMKKVKTKEALDRITKKIKKMNKNFRFNIKDNKVTPFFPHMFVSDFEEPIKYLIETLAESEADKYLAIVGELTSETIIEELKETQKN